MKSPLEGIDRPCCSFLNSMRMNHAVLYVRDAAASARFYRDVLGFTTAVEAQGFAFLIAPGSKNDHDLGLFSIGAAAGDTDAGRRTVGLYHVAWQVSTLAELLDVRRRLIEAGSLVGASDHIASKSLYAKDVDGIEFEVMWPVPPALFTDEERKSRAGVLPLDLDREVARFGLELVSTVPD